MILRAKAVWLGDVEATSEAEAIAKGAEARIRQSGTGGYLSAEPQTKGSILVQDLLRRSGAGR